MASRSTEYRRKKRAAELGVSVDELPDMRGKHGNHVRGQAHPRWQDGTAKSEHGYIRVNVGKSHPLADPNGYAYMHTLVVVASGVAVGRDDVVHHLNGDKTDNRLENLHLTSRSDHGKTHDPDVRRDSAGRYTYGPA